MITPKILLESYELYRIGDKSFCKLASMSNKNNNNKKYLGFWIEVIRNDHVLVLSVQFESLTDDEPVQTMFFHGKESLETFIDDMRLYASKELEKVLCVK